MTLRHWITFFFLFALAVPATGQSAETADSLFEEAKQYDDRGKNKEAAVSFGEAFKLYRELQDTSAFLEAGRKWASALVYLSENEQAMELYRSLLEVDHPANDAYNRGNLYNSMGWSSNRVGKTDRALEYYRKALLLAEESGDELLIGVIHDNIGSLYQDKGDYQHALEYTQLALENFEELGRKRNIAITLNNIAGLYSDIHLFEEALNYYQQSLTIRKKLDNVTLLATGFNNLGFIQKKIGNFDQALSSYQKSIDYQQQAENRTGITRALNNIGKLYRTLGDLDRALEYYRESLDVAGEVGRASLTATVTSNIGSLLQKRGREAEAADYLYEALDLRKEIGNPHRIASSLDDVIQVELNRGRYEQAEGYAAQLKEIGDSTGSYELLKRSNHWMGRLYAEQDHDREALTHFKEAYKYSRQLHPQQQLNPLKELANHYHKMGSDSAVVYGQKVIEIIEENRGRAGVLAELKSGYFEQHSDFYNKMASWMLTYRDDKAGAYRLAEMSKARSLSDELVKSAQNVDRRLPEEVRLERGQKQREINELYTQLEEDPDPEQYNETEKELREKELEYAAYENNLRSEYPELMKLQSPEPITLSEARDITGDDTAVLEYVIGDNELLMFLISRDEVHVEQVSAPDGKSIDTVLTSAVAEFRDTILSGEEKEELQTQSRQLYDLLLQPFEEPLNSYSNLVVVPDGALAYLPFEALTHENHYLIEDYQIKYSPSLTSLTLLNAPETTENGDLLAVARSEFETAAPATRTGNLSSLPSTLREIDSIVDHFEQTETLKEEQVSEEEVKKLLENNPYRYIHMATHGIMNEEHPNRSGLVLTSGEEISETSREDGMLHSSEIFSLNLEADMVVLSACNTGMGQIVNGEGILGLQRSFFYAGASTVVVSLWNVYDRSTAAFMDSFYRSLFEDPPQEEGWLDSMLRYIGWENSIPFGQKATAMREAKLQMIEHPLFNHPVYWAPFVVVGR